MESSGCVVKHSIATASFIVQLPDVVPDWMNYKTRSRDSLGRTTTVIYGC